LHIAGTSYSFVHIIVHKNCSSRDNRRSEFAPEFGNKIVQTNETASYAAASGAFTIPARSTVVFVE
jgi:hypothetical protein